MIVTAALAGYAIVAENGRYWLRDPAGNRFWSLGVCCTGPGENSVNPKNPGYSGKALYGSETAWSKVAKDQFAGFNTLGGWSDQQFFPGMPFTPVLHLGAYAKAPYNDLFDPANIAIMDNAAKDQITKLRNQPGLVGYFSDNELGWWRESLFTSYLGLPPTAAGKRAIVAFLRRHYKSDFNRFKREWVTTKSDFEDLDGTVRLKPGTSGMLAVKGWQTALTTHYYRLMRDLIGKYDPKRLVLGDRYCQFYYLNVARSARPYVDVISTNLGADWNNGDISHFFLDSLRRESGKPVLITEFYMAANENRSGNKNSSGGFPVVETQVERAAAVNRYLHQISSRPYVIGAHWFQFYDEPTYGRDDGENYNMGLVDIHGEPYSELMATFRGTDWNQVHRQSNIDPGGKIPEIPAESTPSLRGWNKAAARVPGKGEVFADLYLSQQKQTLYIGLYAMDFIDEKIYSNAKLPADDRLRLKLSLNGKVAEIRFGGPEPTTAQGAKAEVVSYRGGIRHELILKWPYPVTGPVKVIGELQSHGRAETMTWNATVK